MGLLRRGAPARSPELMTPSDAERAADVSELVRGDSRAPNQAPAASMTTISGSYQQRNAVWCALVVALVQSTAGSARLPLRLAQASLAVSPR